MTKSNMKIAPILNQEDHILPQKHHISFIQSQFQNKEGATRQQNDKIIRGSMSLQQQFKYEKEKDNEQKQQKETLVLNTVLIKVEKRESNKNKNRKNQQKCQLIVPNVNFIQNKIEVQQDEDRKHHRSSHLNSQPIVQIRPRSKNLNKKQFLVQKNSRSLKKGSEDKEKHRLQINNEKVPKSKKQSVCSSSSPAKNEQVHQKMMRKNENKKIDSPRSKEIKGKKSVDGHKMKKKQSFTSDNQILDSRKKSVDSGRNKNGSICECFKNLKIPKERFFSFLLIYQILITFTLLFCLIQNIYSMLSMIVVLVLPTYFGHQCINSRIDSRKLIEQELDPSEESTIQQIRKYKENKNTYFQSLDPQQLTQQNYSITSLNIQSKSHNEDSKQKQNLHEHSINESNAKSMFPLNKSYSQKSSVTNKKPKSSSFNCMLIVPYLQQNQVQNFAKCSKCKTTHINSRIKHCNICNVCHFGYDHYCKWLAVCIDGANYLYFLRFLSSVWCLGIIFNILGLLYIHKISRGLEFKIQDEAKVIYLIVLCFVEIQNLLAFAFSTYVLGYHLWLIKRGVSTRQHFLSQDNRMRRMDSNYCTTSSSTFFKSFFHLLDNTYLLFFIDKFPKLQGLRQKNPNESLTKSILVKEAKLKKEQESNSQQSDQQKTNDFIPQQEHSQEGHYYSASEAGSPVKLSFRNFKQ